MSNLKWIAIYTQPIHRIEFRVLHRINQHEYQAMLPYETVWVKKPGTKLGKETRYALYPRYVFAGVYDVAEDYALLRATIPEIAGIVSKRRNDWSPYVLKDKQIILLKQAMDQCSGVTEVDLHKALKPGKAIEVEVGGTYQPTRVTEVTKKGIKAMIEMFGSMHVVEFPFAKVRAA